MKKGKLIKLRSIKSRREDQPVLELRRKAIKSVGRYCRDFSVPCVERSDYDDCLTWMRYRKEDPILTQLLIAEYYWRVDTLYSFENSL
jgi:hypothetical protein